MRVATLLFQIDASGGALTAGAIFFAVLAVAAYIAFRILKTTAKMALRMTVVVAILITAVIGGFALWWFNAGTSSSSRPGASRPR